MESRKVDSPGLLGSPLTAAASAPCGSVVGDDQSSDRASVEDCAVAPGAVRNHTEAAIKTYRRRAARILSSIVGSPSHRRVDSHWPDYGPEKIAAIGRWYRRRHVD